MDTKETTIYQAILIAAIVIGNIIVYFIITVLRQHRKHRQLYQITIEEVMNAREKERTRIAADLHDDLGPMIAAVHFKLAAINTVDLHTQTLVSDSVQFINNLATRIHFIANDLMPDSLLKNGLVAATTDFIDHITADHSLKIICRHTAIPAITQNRSVHIYRILQEIIHNTIRHAGADRLTIQLSCNKKILIINTADDGVGFSAQKDSGKQNGLGLHNIKSRTEMLGGQVFTDSKPGTGTRYTIEIPL